MPRSFLPALFSSRLVNGVFGLVVLGWVLGAWVGERTLPTLLLAYLPPLLWLLPAGLALLWSLRRRRGRGLALLTLGLAAWGAGLLHWRPQADGELRVLTYNVARGGQGTAAALLSTLRASDADLILLQETNFLDPAKGLALRRGLSGYALTQGREVWTLSRWPVLRQTQHAVPGSTRTFAETWVRGPDGRTLRVVNAHLGTVLITSALRGDTAKVRRTAQARREQVALLCRIAAHEPGPVLLGGDLNTPPRGRLYRRLTHCFGPDAHDRAGRGPGWTFPGLFLRIDHLLARDLRPTRARVLDVAGSDHRPLLVEYRWGR